MHQINNKTIMKDLDLRKLLKVGDVIYSTMFGKVTVDEIDDGDRLCIHITNNVDHGWLLKDGKWTKKGECVLFPSEQNRDWNNYRPIPDKALVWAWDDNDNFERILTFYDAKNRCTFLPVSGQREGCNFDNFELYKGEEPGWAIEARKNLED